MKRIARFEKVSFEQFYKDWVDTFGDTYSESHIKEIYEDIKLPQRATKGSAGNDFYLPIGIELYPSETIKIPTGIRVHMEDGWVLKCYTRSSLGFKYRLRLDNGTGIIDQDYYYSKNEGHIFAKITNETLRGNSLSSLTLKDGEAFMQGIFVEYGITYDDNVEDIRNGGFGSTSK